VECLRALELLVDTEVLEVILIDTGFAGFTVFALATDLVFATIFGFTATFAFAVLDFVLTLDLTFDLTAMVYILTGWKMETPRASSHNCCMIQQRVAFSTLINFSYQTWPVFKNRSGLHKLFG
jgi:hypothetical protein